MLERKRIAAFVAGLLIFAYAAAPVLNAAAEETDTSSSAWEADPELEMKEEEEDKDTYILSGDFMYSMTRNGTACIEDCKSTAAVLDIPDTLDGIAVTELGRRAFGNDPETNTYTEISLPASIEYISSDNPFMFCSNLRSIKVAEQNEHYCSEDGVLYDKNKELLICYPHMKGNSSFTIPGTVKELGVASLYETGLTAIKFPAALEKIGVFAVADLETIEAIDLSGTKVPYINSYAVKGCVRLKDIKLPETLEYIGLGAFAECRELRDIEFPSSLVEIGQYAFLDTGLSAAVIPDSVSRIDYCAFGYNTDENGSIVANNSFSIVGTPNSAAHIYAYDSDPDYDYQNSFVFLTPEEYKEKQDLLAVDRIKSGDFEYAVISTGTVLTLCTSSEKTITIPSSIDGHDITMIYPACFTNTQATEIIIPDTVTELREMAFYNCPYLKKITVPASVKTIGNNAFDKCVSLEHIEFCGAEKIGSSVFCDCESLKTFKAAGCISEWDDIEPFIYCPELESIEIGSGDGNYCSENGIMYSKDKTKLLCYPANKPGKSFTAPDSVKEIGQSAFMDNRHLEKIKLKNVESIGAYGFEGCEKLSGIYISDKLTMLGSDAFYDCHMLKSLRLPGALTDIGACAFGYYHNEHADKEKGESSDALISGFTLYAPKNSTAYKFAKSAGIKVVSGTARLFGKNISSAFVYTMAVLLGAAVIAFIGAAAGKAAKKKKAEKEAAEKKAQLAERRRQQSENKEDDTIE